MSDKKVVLVTAAGSGMGASVARKLAAESYIVSILSSSGRGEKLAEELGGFGFTGSNLNSNDLASYVDATLEKYHRIDAVVNSAGHGPRGDLLSISDDEWHLGMDTYFLNVVRVARLVTPHLQKAGGGAIVNISTFAAFEPDAGFPTSSVFRAGLASFTKLYADAYAANNIRMNNVLPGFIDSFPEDADTVKRIPLGRYGKTGEIADTVAFLLSDGAAYISGQNLRVDGGLTRSV